MKKESYVESLCIFGSVARATSDALSDADVLVVSSCAQRRKELQLEWQAKGWSVSVYTPSRLMASVRAKSLFVQHLKYEGLLLRDQNRWLENLLNSATPKSSYIQDCFDSVNLALPIERLRGDEYIDHFPIAADLAFVAIRNFGINMLANQKVLKFDYDQVAFEVGKHYQLTRQERTLLHSLRIGKVKYRFGYETVPLTGTVGELRSLLSKIFPKRPLLEIKNGPRCIPLSSGYCRLRDFEATVVSYFGGKPSNSNLVKLGIENVWSRVLSPSEYSWQVRHFSESEVLSSKLMIDLNGSFKRNRSFETRENAFEFSKPHRQKICVSSRISW